MAINETAAAGFERGASDYERGRPGYPPEVIAELVTLFHLGPDCSVVDLGAGTGKFTRQLVATGASVVAVEPIDAMRAEFAKALPATEVRVGTAEAIPAADGSVDLVTCAQAFHWFDPGRAFDEVRRVLRPGGGLAMVWNTRDPSVPWTRELDAIMTAVAGPSPRYRSGLGGWEPVLDSHSGFTPVTRATWPNPRPTDVGTMLARIASVSYVSALPAEDRGRVLDEVAQLLATGPMAESTSETFIEPNITDLYWCRRI